MSPNSLDNFLDQLVLWTQQVIDTGRTPFRKVEVAPSLLTSPCSPLPYLTLWINRDSHMAGGLILLPERAAEEAFETGMALCSALGLSTFATWDRQRVTTWRVDGATPEPIKTTTLGKIQSAAGFRKILHELLDQLKVLSVSAAPVTENLSPYWLANLIHLGLADCAPGIRDHLHSTENHRTTDWPGGRHPDLAKGLLTVCRLLAVGHANLLARTVQAEGLERALRFSIDQLPEELNRALSFDPAEPALPEAANTRLHHLWRRLQQLDALQQRERLARAVELLEPNVEHLTPKAPPPDRVSAVSSLTINPQGVPGQVTTEAEIGPPALLAWRQLLRWLRELPAPAMLGSRADQLPAGFQPRIISAALDSGAAPAREDRAQLDTNLRLAWPSRRFQLPNGTPAWHYELLHILGRAAGEAEFHLRLPASWLKPAEGETLWELFCSDFQLTALTLDEDGTTRLNLKKSVDGQGDLQLESATGKKSLPWSSVRKRSLQHLYFALTWPPQLYRLIENDTLVLTDEQPFPLEYARENWLYWKSSWGERLAAWCGFDPADLSLELLVDEHPPISVFPGTEKLQPLSNFLWDPETPLPEGEQYDRDIALWVGSDLADPDLPAAPAVASTNPSRPSRSAHKNRVERLEARLLSDGLPKFPEHYLYDHYRPELQSYDLPGHLDENGRFFGQIELRGSKGESLQVESEALAGCLILASRIHQQVDLPTDTGVAADILTRYLKDLRQLREPLERESRRIQENRAAGQRLSNRLWKRWQLPDWETIEQVSALFSGANFVE